MKINFLLCGAAICSALVMLPSRSEATVTSPASETPTDGTTYYIYNGGADSYLTNGGYNSSQAIIGNFSATTAYQFIVSGTASSFKLQRGRHTAQYLRYYGDSNNCFVDGGDTYDTWTANAVNSGEYYTIQVAGTTSLKYWGLVPSGTVGGTYCNNYANVNIDASDATTKWKFISIANIDKFQAQMSLYQVICHAETLISNGKSSETATLSNAETAAESVYNNSSSTATDFTNSSTTLQNAITQYLTTSSSTVTTPCDMTSYIKNPNFTNNNYDGWTDTHSGGSYSKGLTEVEYFDGTAGLTYDFNQTISSLPAGFYKLYVQGFERVTVNNNTAFLNGSESIKSQLYATDNGTTTTQYTLLKSIYDDGTGSTEIQNKTAALTAFSNSKFDNCLCFYKSSGDNTTLTIGVRLNEAGVVNDWTILKNFRLYYYGNNATNTTLNENAAYTPVAATGATTLARTMKSTWSTLCVPFDIPTSDIPTVFGSDAQIATLVNATVSGKSYTLAFSTKNPSVKANVPCLIKTSTSTPSTYQAIISASGASTVTPSSVDIKLIGNYKSISNLYNEDNTRSIFFISNDKFYLANSGSTVALKPFKAYISAANISDACAISIDGSTTETTDIEGISSETQMANGDVFNVNGQMVRMKATNLNGLSKGIYIMNGKKIIVK